MATKAAHRGRAAGVLRRRALHPGVGGAAGRGTGSLRCDRPARARRIVLTGVLVNAATYGLLYWGMLFVRVRRRRRRQHVDEPGVPLRLAILFGQERASWRHLAALVLGIAGLLILFSGKASFTGSDMELWAAAAIVGSLGLLCLGSVLSRPLLEQVTPLQLTAAQGVVGAVGMSALSLALEPVSAATFAALLAPPPLAGLLFIVFAGTFVAYDDLPAAGARLGRAARRALFVRVAGGGAGPRQRSCSASRSAGARSQAAPSCCSRRGSRLRREAEPRS